jgi:predicted transposase/invertase (TIGR01784 family)
MKFIDPCNDWAFKRIFGSKESEPVLLAFLNDLLHGGRPIIQSVKIIDPYLPSQVLNLKDTSVDVRAMLQDETEILIEMQMFPISNYRERALFNGAKCLVSQLGRGTRYEEIRPVTLITVADCFLLPETDRWLNHYTLRERHSGDDWPAHGLELVFIELPKVNLPELSVRNAMHDWLAFLKNAQTWHSIPRAVTHPAVREALRMARFDSLSPNEHKNMNARQLYRADQRNMLRYARTEGRQEGVAEGRKEGMQQGMQQGMHRATMDIAHVLLKRGMAVAEVAEATGLSLAAVTQLLSGKKTAAKKSRARAKRASS